MGRPGELGDKITMDMHIYAQGIVYMSVCVPKTATVAEIEAEANIIEPTGIPSKWQVADKDFSNGTTNPSPCERMPNDRMHYLLNC